MAGSRATTTGPLSTAPDIGGERAGLRSSTALVGYPWPVTASTIRCSGARNDLRTRSDMECATSVGGSQRTDDRNRPPEETRGSQDDIFPTLVPKAEQIERKFIVTGEHQVVGIASETDTVLNASHAASCSWKRAGWTIAGLAVAGAAVGLGGWWASRRESARSEATSIISTRIADIANSMCTVRGSPITDAATTGVFHNMAQSPVLNAKVTAGAFLPHADLSRQSRRLIG